MRRHTLEERGRSRHAAARLRPVGGAFKLHGDLFVRSGRGRGEMPSTMVRVGVPIGCVRRPA